MGDLGALALGAAIGTIAVIVRQEIVLFIMGGIFVVFPLLSCFLSIAIMVGMLGYLNWKVTVISSNFISLMLILTMEINIHYVERYKQLQAEFPKKKENYLTYLTTTKIFTPILYAVLTTALAFLSFIFCDIKPVIDFGWMMTLGLFISLFVSMILLPYLIIKFKPKAPPIFYLESCNNP